MARVPRLTSGTRSLYPQPANRLGVVAFAASGALWENRLAGGGASSGRETMRYVLPLTRSSRFSLLTG